MRMLEAEWRCHRCDHLLAGAHDILRVLLTQGSDADLDHKKTALIPFVKEIVPVVDKQRQVLEITPPKGLIEATTTAMKSRRQRQKLVKGAERTQT